MIRFWRHFCRIDRCLIDTAEGEECSWCGEREAAEDAPPEPSEQPVG